MIVLKDAPSGFDDRLMKQKVADLREEKIRRIERLRMAFREAEAGVKADINARLAALRTPKP